MTLRPDFIIIGAMKSGTSTLQAQLVQQPGVFMTTPKEPNFFSDNDIYAQGMGWYEALFEDAQPSDLKGEASTHYTKLPTYPETVSRLVAAVQNPKLIYVLRNPVDRAVSHFVHAWSVGEVGNNVAREFEKSSLFQDYGCYGAQIAPFVEAFGRDAILLTSLEQIKNDPQTVLDQISEFLGAANGFVWKDDLESQNVSANRIRRFPLHGVLFANPVARWLRQALVPKSLREKIRKSRTIKQRPELPDTVRLSLEKAFLQDREKLAGFFPDHPALTLCYPFAEDRAS